MSSTIEIDQLRVGMFVHLDLGWWAHPFALSSFLVTSPDQVATIRGLGLKRLRWSPEKSRDEAPEASESPPVVVEEQAGHAAPAPQARAAAPATAARRRSTALLWLRNAPPTSCAPSNTVKPVAPGRRRSIWCARRLSRPAPPPKG